MRSAFFGLELGRRALQSQQRAIDVTGHNIANANTPGFTRQEAVLGATTPFMVPAFNRPAIPGQLGTGVEVQKIRRLRHEFIDRQIRGESKRAGFWEQRQKTLEKLEVIFQESPDSGVSAVLSQFWEAWHELSKNPQAGSPARALVQQRGIAVAETFNHIYTQLQETQSQLNQSVEIKIQEVNSYAVQIAGLNAQIVTSLVVGDTPNDLYDQRDLLIDQLACSVDIEVNETQTGAVTIFVRDADGDLHEIVSETETTEIKVEEGGDGLWQLYYEDDSGKVELDFDTGEMGGLLRDRDQLVPAYLAKIEGLAEELKAAVNNVHTSGYDINGSQGLNFFVDPGIGGLLQLNSDLEGEDGQNRIAASGEDGEANGNNALSLVALQGDTVGGLGKATFSQFIAGMVSKLGVEGQEAEQMVDGQQLLLKQLNQQKESVSGVSQDEEIIRLMGFQHAYNAAARVVTTMDELLDIVINRMGLVGR